MGKLHSQEVPFWKNTSILWVYPNLVEIWQYLWPDLGTLSRLLICSTSGWNSSFGDCRRMSEPGAVKGFEQPFTITKIRNWTKKRPLRVKPNNGQKKINRTVFQVYSVVYLPENKHHSIRCSAACLWGGDPNPCVCGFLQSHPTRYKNFITRNSLTHPVA